MNKRAKFKVEPQEDWPQMIACGLLIIGFILAIGTSVVLNYILIAFAGLIFGRTLATYEYKWPTTTLLIMVGFLGGFLLGAFRTDRRLIIVIFIVALVVSYFLHKNEIISTI